MMKRIITYMMVVVAMLTSCRDDEVLVDVIRKNNSLSYEELRLKLGTKQYNIIKKKKRGKFDFRG